MSRRLLLRFVRSYKNFVKIPIYHFTPNRIGEWFYIAAGYDARGKAAFADLTPPPTAAEGECNRACSDCRAATAVAELVPQTPASAGASVGTHKVIRFWITVGVNLYIIAFVK